MDTPTLDHHTAAPAAETRQPDRSDRVLPLVAAGAAAAGVAGMFLGPAFISDPAVYAAGPEAVHGELGGQLLTQLGAGALYLSAALLLWFGRGLVASLSPTAPERRGLIEGAGSMISVAAATVAVAAILKSVLAGGLPGGVDADFYTLVDVAVINTIVGQFQFGAFIPMIGAMAIVAVLSLRHRVLPRWVGIPSAVLALLVIGMTLAVNLPWSAGLVTPLWLVLVAVAMWRRAGTR